MVNDEAALIQVEIIYARPDQAWRRLLELPAGASAQQALSDSGVLDAFPELAGAVLPPMGIYGRSCAPRQVLQPGDRLEVYRPLVFDPMESRRRRAQHRQRQRKPTLSGT